MVSYPCVLCFAKLIDTDSVGCGMWYRRITEYNDVDPPPPKSRMPLRKPQEEIVVFGQTSFSKLIFGPELPEHLAASKKRKREDVQDDDITLFKRVRVLSKKTRVRRIKQISGPFTRLAAAKNGFTGSATSVAFQNAVAKSGSTMPNQLSKTSYEMSFGNSMVLNVTAALRTDDTLDGDDSDNNADDSGDDEGDCDKDEDDTVNWSDDSAVKLSEIPKGDNPRHLLDEGLTLDLVNSGVDFEYHWGTTPLCRAVELGNEVIVRTLLVRGVNVNKGDVIGWTGLMRAAERGDTQLVALLLSHKAHTEMSNVYGNTALQIAAAKGHLSVVQMLLNHGASLSTNAWAGQTELQLAVANGHIAVVRLLLERGADSTVKDAHGLTLLHKAAAREHNPVFQLLLQSGADVEAIDNYGRTPLQMPFKTFIPIPLFERNLPRTNDVRLS